MGPGSEICTPAAAMTGVGVRVGVRVGRRVDVAFGLVVFVTLGDGLGVTLWMSASEVGLGPCVVVALAEVGEGEAIWVSSGKTTGEGVISAC
jgi:hypothetical protein